MVLELFDCFAASGLWSTDLMSFIGKKDEEEDEDDKSSENHESLEKHESLSLPLTSPDNVHDKTSGEHGDIESNVKTYNPEEHEERNDTVTEEAESMDETKIVDELAHEFADIVLKTSNEQKLNTGTSEEPSVDHPDKSESPKHKSTEHESASSEDQVTGTVHESKEVAPSLDLQKTENELKKQEQEEVSVPVDAAGEVSKPSIQVSDDASEMVAEVVSTYGTTNAIEYEADIKEQLLSSGRNFSENSDSMAELEKVKNEMKLMETALLGAARQAQVH